MSKKVKEEEGKGKHLIIRNKEGRVVDFIPNRGRFIYAYNFVSDIYEGMYPERTNDIYTQKWGKYWLTGTEAEEAEKENRKDE